jgi:hypothetical protein
MTYRVSAVRTWRPQAVPVALAAVAALLWSGSSTRASAQDGDGCAACLLDSRLSHLHALLDDDPTRGRLEQRLEDKPWIGQDWATLPVAVKPADQALDVAASLQHVGSFEARRLQQKINEAKTLAPSDLSLPKPVVAASAPFDVWSRIEVSGLGSATGESRRSTVGADYRLARRTLLGISAGVNDPTWSAASDTRLAAYFAAKPWAPITFDAKAQWAEVHTVEATSVVSTQSAVSARVKGDFNYRGLRVTPIVSVAHGIDAAGTAGGTVEKSTVALTPRISQPFALREGVKMEPFLSLKSAVDFGNVADGTQHGIDTTHGLGAGFTYAKPNAYSLSVSTGIEQSASADKSNVSGKLELKLPLR